VARGWRGRERIVLWCEHAGWFVVRAGDRQAASDRADCADAKLMGGLNQLSANLRAAGSLSSGLVTIHAYGSLEGHFYIDVDFPVEVGIDGG
jgi:hypothetical protein